MINLKKVSIIALGLLIGGVIGILLTLPSVNKSEWVTEEKLINDEEFMNIEVMTNNAEINFLPTNDDTAKVELTGNNSNYLLSTDVKDSTLLISVKNPQKKLFQFNFLSHTLSLTVYVPEKLYETIKLESNNGRIHADNIEVREIGVKSDNGRIELSNVMGDRVTAIADNGAIELKGVSAPTVSVRTKNGAILLEDIDGEIIGKTNNGRISLLTKQMNDPLDLATDNGRIQIQTEEEPTNATILVNTANGRVDVFGSSSRNAVSGNGDNMIQLTTANGSVTIEKK
ncbi:DUF4097 family beta strand repeat-containing protein [Halalkalibacter okhensis]|uniref:DUF4097 domain-containing protein n=1 Tax=Halalkalibacter okhensis TaxID=333138 RepID=A0A0B0II63_9BACI|nr:DUF4097 family beta strand repeat-containing protein [Halalkalibacter okhensis]KHF40572.1 hypothetical protein LQ50_08610 [Halalkalibacter okhensis]